MDMRVEWVDSIESADRRVEWEDDTTGVYHYHAPGGVEVVYRFRAMRAAGPRGMRLVEWDAEVLLVDGIPVVEAEAIYYRIMWHEQVARVVQAIVNETAKGA